MSAARTGYVSCLKCLVCGREYPHGDLLTCPACGPGGILDVRYDYDAVRMKLALVPLASGPENICRYSDLLPVICAPVDLPRIGWTPVRDAPRLAAAVGVRQLFLKDDGRNPTLSFKDRASAMGIAKAREFGYTSIACASTGNAASSLAGLAAAAGLQCFIFVPDRAPEPKIAQLLIFGATVLRVNGTYEEAFDLCSKACKRFGWYNRNSGTNPFLVEGKKTAGLEIVEQLGTDLPDWVIVPVGDGCTVGGIGKGLREMAGLGLASRVPKLLGVQAAGACAVVDAFTSGKDVLPGGTETIADSIAVGTPRNWRRALSEIRESGGFMVTASDEEILDAMRTTARLGGVFGEPAGVAGVAGLKNAVAAGIVRPEESALVVITGNGLKDVRAARRAAGEPITVGPDIALVERALQGV